MPYTKTARPYKREYALQKRRGEHEDRMERQRARRALDAQGVNRKGKDVSHKKMLSEGGSNKDGYFLEAPSKNRARNGHNPGEKRGKKKYI
jgi:hypothetical protein